MAHFAKLNDASRVEQIIVVNNEILLDTDGVEQESLGLAFIASLGFDGTWVQCSYNGSFRNQYPAHGDEYRQDLDAFIQPKPGVTEEISDWVLNEETLLWEPVNA